MSSFYLFNVFAVDLLQFQQNVERSMCALFILYEYFAVYVLQEQKYR